LHSGLRSKDIENGWGYQYGWSEEEFRHTWREFAGNAIDVRTDAAIANYPSQESRQWPDLVTRQ
jgi:hypothetical protein